MDKAIKILRIAAIVFVSIVVLILTNKLLRHCDRPEQDGWVMVRQAYLDSLDHILSLPRDTIRDTIRIPGKPVTVIKEVPVPVYINPSDTSLKKYSDTMRNKDIDATIDLEVRGRLVDLKWHYTPIKEQIITEIEKLVPYPVEKEVPVLVSQRGFYGVLGIGKGFEIDKPAVSAEVNYLTKKDALIGFEAGYFQATYFKMRFGLRF